MCDLAWFLVSVRAQCSESQRNDDRRWIATMTKMKTTTRSASCVFKTRFLVLAVSVLVNSYWRIFTDTSSRSSKPMSRGRWSVVCTGKSEIIWTRIRSPSWNCLNFGTGETCELPQLVKHSIEGDELKATKAKQSLKKKIPRVAADSEIHSRNCTQCKRRKFRVFRYRDTLCLMRRENRKWSRTVDL